MIYSKRRRPFPNLALMKLSAWHKKQGDDVSLNFPLNVTDKIYASCVFTWHKPEELSPLIEYGGGGLAEWDVVLPTEIEHIMPDYDLYNCDFSMGYTSRGCIRNCPFCKVRIKEGPLKPHAEPTEFYDPRFKKIVLLDNNPLASPNCIDTFKWLIEKQLETDYNQGLDIRCLDDEKIFYLKQIRVEKYRFAFDSLSYEKQVREGIDLMLKAGINKRRLSFYVLVGFDKDDGAIERMKILQSYGVDVYPMIYKGDDGKEPQIDYGFTETLKFHGARGNLRKFLRVTGRL
jgi:hypothetical protein